MPERSRFGLTKAQEQELLRRTDNVATPVASGVRNKLELNKTEQQYLDEVLVPDLDVVGVWPHGIRLVLGDNSRYEPDFLVMRASGLLEIHEVKVQIVWKGRNIRGLDDSRQKVKSTATLFPFPLVIASKKNRKQGGGWHIERFEPTRRYIERAAPQDTPAGPDSPA